MRSTIYYVRQYTCIFICMYIDRFSSAPIEDPNPKDDQYCQLHRVWLTLMFLRLPFIIIFSRNFSFLYLFFFSAAACPEHAVLRCCTRFVCDRRPCLSSAHGMFTLSYFRFTCMYPSFVSTCLHQGQPPRLGTERRHGAHSSTAGISHWVRSEKY